MSSLPTALARLINWVEYSVSHRKRQWTKLHTACNSLKLEDFRSQLTNSRHPWFSTLFTSDLESKSIHLFICQSWTDLAKFFSANYDRFKDMPLEHFWYHVDWHLLQFVILINPPPPSKFCVPFTKPLCFCVGGQYCWLQAQLASRWKHLYAVFFNLQLLTKITDWPWLK